MSTSMVASSSMSNTSFDPVQRSVLVRSDSRVGKMLGRKPSYTVVRSESPKPAGPRNPPPPFKVSSGREPENIVAGPQPTRAVRRHGSIFKVPSTENPSLESFTSIDSSYSLISIPPNSASKADALRAPSPAQSRTSSESLPEFRSFSANRKRKPDTTAPAPLILGKSNGSTQHSDAQPPNFLAIPPAHGGRSRRANAPKPSASPSASTALGARDRNREAKIATITKKSKATETSERLRTISKSLEPPDSGLLGLYPEAQKPYSNASGAPTPLTPSFRLVAPTMPEHRRQKLQKLARTLGENVPPSLVFPDWDKEKLLRPQRSPSLSAPRTPTSPALAAKLAAESEFTSTSSSSASKAKKYIRRRSASVGNLFALDLDVGELKEVRGKNAKGVSEWKPPSEWADGPSLKETQGPVSPANPTIPTKKGSGEQVKPWNAADYDMVMDRLRNLRR